MRGLWFCMAAALGLGGCATVVPQFDIPRNDGGPTVESIRREVECELREIVIANDLSKYLVAAHDVDVGVILNLDVTDDGALAPTSSYLHGLFTFAGGASLEQSREQNFQEQMFFSLAELQALVRHYGPTPNAAPCGSNPDTNLSGRLGLKEAWDLALSGPYNLNWKGTSAAGSGAFGGVITFTVKKSLTATGPTWALKAYKGPGQFLSAYENNIDKLTFAFVEGPAVKKDKELANKAVQSFLNTVQQGTISTSLTVLQNK